MDHLVPLENLDSVAKTYVYFIVQVKLWWESCEPIYSGRAGRENIWPELNSAWPKLSQ